MIDLRHGRDGVGDRDVDADEELVVQLGDALAEVADSSPTDQARLAIIAVREWDDTTAHRPRTSRPDADTTLPTVEQIQRWWRTSQRCLVDSTDLPAPHIRAVLDAIVALQTTGPCDDPLPGRRLL